MRRSDFLCKAQKHYTPRIFLKFRDFQPIFKPFFTFFSILTLFVHKLFTDCHKNPP